MKKFKIAFFEGDKIIYSKKFDLDAQGIKSAAIEMKLWEKGNEYDKFTYTSIVLEDES
jgi:hypothetical protein